MKAIILNEQGARRYAKPCPGCTKKVKAGEAVLALTIDDVSFNAKNLAIHVNCIRAEIAGVPLAVDAEAERFELLRQRIVTEGTPFPPVVPVLPDKTEVAVRRRRR